MYILLLHLYYISNKFDSRNFVVLGDIKEQDYSIKPGANERAI